MCTVFPDLVSSDVGGFQFEVWVGRAGSEGDRNASQPLHKKLSLTTWDFAAPAVKPETP